MNVEARTLSLSLSAATLLIVFFGSFPLYGESSNEFSITSDPGDQRYPAIYENIVVWEDTRNGNSDIFGCNLSTGEEFQITAAPGYQRNPAIYGDYVVWEDYRNDRGALYGYDLVTKEEFLITAGPKWDPAIYGNIVVWTDVRTGNYDIFGYDLSTRQEFQITTDPEWQSKPVIYQNIVVWEDHRSGHSAIYGYNLSTGREFRISKRLSFLPDEDRSDPALYKDIVVWKEDYGDILCGLNLSTSKNYRIAIAQNGECDRPGCYLWFDEGRPAVYEDVVIWVDCRYGNADILGYNFSKGQEFEVTTHRSCQFSPALYGNTVVWEDNRKGNWDIYGTKLIPPLTPTQFAPRIHLLDSEVLFTAVFAGCVLLITFYIGKDVWYVRKFVLLERTKLSSVQSKDFSRINYVRSLSLYIVYSVLFGLFFIYIFDFLVGCILFSVPVIMAFDSFWKKKIPQIRVTADEIMVFPKRPGNPITIAWNTVQKAHVELWTDIPSRVELFLSNGKKVGIDLNDISREDREDFIQTLKQFIK